MITVITPKRVALNIRAWREHLGFKQHVVADEIGVSRKWYVDLENGKVKFKVDHVLVIAQFFEIPPTEFFKAETDFNKQKIASPELEYNLEYIVELKIIQVFGKLLQKMDT